MNAVATTPKQTDAVLVISEALQFASTGIADLVTLETALDVALELGEFQVNAASALDQATRLVIDDQRSFGLGGDILKAVNAQVTTLNEKRLARTRKIDEFKTSFAGLFKPAGDTLTKAKALLGDKLNEWGRKEQQRLREEAAAKQKADEDRALALAAAQSSLGDQAGADQIIEDAAKVIDKAPPAKATVRGSYGSTTSSRRVYDGEVTDVRKFVKWLLDQEAGDISNVIDFKKAGINAIAKHSDGKYTVPGFTNKSRDDFGAR